MLCEIETALAGIRAGLLADLETMGAAPERRRLASLQCGFRNRALASGWRRAPQQGRGAGDGARPDKATIHSDPLPVRILRARVDCSYLFV